MDAGEAAVRAVVAAAGVVTVLATVGSAVRAVVVPRGVPVRLSRAVFSAVRAVYLVRIGRAPEYRRRDRVMASYAPAGLLALLVAWLLLVWLGYAALLWGLAAGDVVTVIELSGSSLTTLGFVGANAVGPMLAAVSEAVVGLTLLALLITYLPSLYASFSRREHLVSKLEVRAGSPPSGTELLVRAWVLERFHLLNPLWSECETWFVDIEETHTSFPALPFFRSPQPEHSWVTTAGAVLDAASLYASTVDVERDVDAELCIRAGYLALRRVAGFYGIPYEPDPAPDAPITVTRDEYDEVVDTLVAAGVPVRADREAAWRAFAGWRVNYDRVLVALASLTMAPYAPWSSDRSLAGPRGRG